MITFSKAAGEKGQTWNDHFFKDYSQDDRVTSYSIAMLEDVPALLRRMVRGGIKRGMPASMRRRFLTVVKGEAEWKRYVGMQDDKEAYLLLLDGKSRVLRGGAFKPRTSPYDFQGMELEGLKLLRKAKERTGLAIILIAWVNHHAAFRLVDKSSSSFIYANGFLLLTVVFTPFPTALVGEYLLTDHAAPAVVIYNAVTVVQAVGWILVSGAAVRGGLTRDEKSTLLMRHNARNGYFALVVYSLLALIALWFPLGIAIVTTLLWAYWLVFGLRAG
jgi:uncharacterized membrane protein